MAFSLRNFILHGIKDSIGKVSDFQVIDNALGWYQKKILFTEDLAEINMLIEAKNTPPVEEPVEELEAE